MVNYKGILNINKFGFGIIKSNKFNKKIKVDKKKLNFNIDGEEVKFEIIKENEYIIYANITSLPKLEGRKFTGFMHHRYKNDIFVYNKKFGKRNLILCDALDGLKENDILEFKIKKFKSNKFYGNISKRIGTFFDKESITKLLISENNLVDQFSEKILKKVLKIKKRYNKDYENEIQNRTDLTNLNTFTIDPNGARDLDDAVCVIKNNENYKIYINIADVSYFVKQGTSIDKEALKRSFSVYLPSKVIRMLPPLLSEDLCSLLPGSYKYAVTTEVDVNKEGKIIKWNTYKSIIESKNKFTYEEVFNILENDLNHKFKNDLLVLKEVSDLLKKKRMKIPDKKYNNETNKIETYYHDYSHGMIEELMILNNILVAKTLSSQNKLYPSRFHPSIDLKIASNVIPLLEKINNISINNLDVDTIQYLIDNNKQNTLINIYFIQRMLSKARYDYENSGHWALNLNYYSHFTSPIRRYSDLISHRLLFNENINENKLSNMMNIINENENNYQKIDFYMEDIKNIKNIKNNEDFYKNKILEGVIIRVSNPTITIFIPEICWVKDLHIADISKVKLNYNEEFKYFYNDEIKIMECDKIKLKVNKINIGFLEVKFDIIT
jgi:ribonuclease R